MPLFCSSSLWGHVIRGRWNVTLIVTYVLSKKRNFPASLLLMKPFEHTRLSERVVLPWSTWARMQMLRMF